MSEPVATRPRRTALTLLSRSAVRWSRDRSSFDRTLVYEVDSETRPGVVYSVVYTYRDGSYVCDCLAGQHGTRCKHVHSVVYWTTYDRTRRDLARLNDTELHAYDRDLALARAGLLAPWLHWEIDSDACADEIAERAQRTHTAA